VDLRKTLFVLPNLVTLASVFCGFNAIRIVALPAASEEELYRAAVLLIFAMLFDLLDGRVARMTKTQSAFGLQLDSLADVISFGVAPSLLVYQWVLYRHPIPGLLVAFLFVACGAIRLARFNVLTSGGSGAPSKPGKYIVGLPIPGAAGILVSIIVANHAAAGVLGGVEYVWPLLFVSLVVANHGVGGALGDERYTVMLFAVTIALSLLMVSTVKFRSFKDLKLNTGTVLLVLFTVGSSAIVWNRLRPQFVLIWLLSVYVFIGLLETVRSLMTRLAARSRSSVPPAADAR
jgi:CDP-diacylglycerol--serine O-phosphatidyltransferase